MGVKAVSIGVNGSSLGILFYTQIVVLPSDLKQVYLSFLCLSFCICQTGTITIPYQDLTPAL